MVLTLRQITLAISMLAVLTLSPRGAEADSPSPVPGWRAVSSTNWDVKTPAVQNWRRMLARWADGQACESDTCTAKGWAEMVAQVKAAGDLLSQVKLANTLINDPSQHPYKEDINNWNTNEYWETPFEFLKKSGDAEDFAIAKYFLLKAAGVPAASMQIIAVRIKSLSGIGHVILAVTVDDSRTLVLDNRVAAVLDAKLVKDEFKPAIGINENKWWAYIGG